MLRVALTTLGCKVNQYETQKILESFESAGFAVVPIDQVADVYVVNTCSVTSIAESKSRYAIRKLAKQNPEAKLVVTGCAAQMSLNRGEVYPGVDVLVPNPDKLKTLDYLFREFPELHSRIEKPQELLRPTIHGRTRATLKVQDGCSVYCSYCSIPYTRPEMKSRPWREVLTEAQRMAEMGYQEAILTGVLIGSYGPETGSEGPDFPELVSLLARDSGIPRLRISSIEMQQVTDRLVDHLVEGRVVPHLHIPLQSGDTEVLRDMNRPYGQEEYLELCRWLYRTVPDLSITTDIMVGFPTETDERFQSSVNVCEEVGFLKVHVFSFSPRFGTPADKWGDPVSPQVKASRRTTLSEISGRTAQVHARNFLGKRMEVLAEAKPVAGGLMEGLTANYLTVRFAAPLSVARQLVLVELQEERDGVLYGETVSSARPPALVSI
ncbi:MAG: tRNA (N(6)-L-threonylcarbamoyladenosine(37)-C(2))-methylthiotransferase MtaB [Armatimonadetes bacterium]|nr:tRNA (N(6)-L-threonylcarbamoyladenosine(37)-C(2))-methylthiotransferase MtaB [Armatimonadota bacterium]